MKYYKDTNNKVFVDPILANHSGLVEITVEEFQAIANPPKTAEQLQAETIAYFKGLYLGVVDAKLEELDYDSLDRVAGYACRPTSIYNAESIKILDWHESIIIYNYALLKDVKDGLIQVPTDEEYLAGVPVYV